MRLSQTPQIIGYVASALLVAFILYGAYQFYFKKPVPINQTTYVTAQDGSKVEVGQVGSAKKDRRLLTAVSYDIEDKGVSVSLGWLW